MWKLIGRWRGSISEFDEVNCRSKFTICGKKTKANWQLRLVCTSFTAKLEKRVCGNCDQFWLVLVQTWERCLWQLRQVCTSFTANLRKVFVATTTSFNANFGEGVPDNCGRFGLVLVQTWRKVFLPAHAVFLYLLLFEYINKYLLTLLRQCTELWSNFQSIRCP